MKAAVAMVVACVAVLTAAGGGTPALPAAERGGLGQTALPTNATARVQCLAQTKSGNRCKRRAVCGERYCRQHSATITIRDNIPNSPPQLGIISPIHHLN